MPLLNIVSNKEFLSEEKQDIAKTVTQLLTQLWKVLPDKVGTQVSCVKDDELSRGGITPTNEEFSQISRRTSLISNDFYTVPAMSGKEYLLNITIDTWTGFSFVSKTQLAEQITQYFEKTYDFSGDNIIIYFRDILPENWFQNGISGRNPEFLTKSRQVIQK